MTEHRVCSLCMGQNMVSMTDGRRIMCPACSPSCCVPQLEPSKVDNYLDQCSISSNLAIVEPVVETKTGMSAEMRLSRSEKMKRSWIERKAKAAEAKAE